MDQIERISYMENILNEALEAIETLDEALEKYTRMQEKIAELDAYYGSADWWKDFEDDRNGKLPCGLKRGVLSEDAVYNCLTDHQRLSDRLGLSQNHS